MMVMSLMMVVVVMMFDDAVDDDEGDRDNKDNDNDNDVNVNFNSKFGDEDGADYGVNANCDEDDGVDKFRSLVVMRWCHNTNSTTIMLVM